MHNMTPNVMTITKHTPSTPRVFETCIIWAYKMTIIMLHRTLIPKKSKTCNQGNLEGYSKQ